MSAKNPSILLKPVIHPSTIWYTSMTINPYFIVKSSLTIYIKFCIMYFACASSLCSLNLHRTKTDLLRLPIVNIIVVIPSLLTSPGHQRPWYQLRRMGKIMSYTRKGFNYPCHTSAREGYKIDKFLCFLWNSARKKFAYCHIFCFTFVRFCYTILVRWLLSKFVGKLINLAACE